MPEQLRLPAPPAPDDAPLTPDELVALSRLGWEIDGSATTPAGLLLIRMRDTTSHDSLATQARTPGGWRMELL